MNFIDEKQIQYELAEVKTKKPYKLANKEYPFQQLTDKEFELLLFTSFRKHGRSILDFEDCHLVAGSGDQGRDIIMVQKGKTVGVIQCKKYETPITKPQAAKEIIKFVLYALHHPRIYDFNNLTYFFAVSKGFNGVASILLEHFSLQIEREADLKKWIRAVQSEFKKTNLDPSIDFIRVLKALKSMKVRKLLPYDIGELIEKDAAIIDTFFAVDKVIDTKTFQDLLDKPKMDLTDFMGQYRESQRNNFSRINFFGLALTTKPREVPFERLFVTPTLRRRGQKLSSYFFDKYIEQPKDAKLEISSIKDSVKSTLNIDGLSDNLFQDIYIKNTKSVFSIPVGAVKASLMIEGLAGKILLDRYYNQLESSDVKPATLHLEEIFHSKKNVVVLGKPGAGKSSLVKHLMIHMLSRSYQSEGIPFRVELHKYNQEKKQNSVGFIDYIFNQLRTEHQINKLMENDLVDFLTHYKSVIFFDGMDEVLDVQERISVRNEIENIAAQYKNLKCVVTSRFESYDEVSFNEQQFEVFEVNDFNDEQVENYVQKWYGIEESDLEVRRKEVATCLEELHSIEDELKRNPLLLTLILILYRNELELPTSKLDVYEGCTLTIVDVRDSKEKKLGTELPISNKIATFSSLAYWQFNKMMKKNQTPVTYESALLHVRNYLLNKGEFEFEHEADEIAQNFLDFAFIRSIYVENNFTHKTFLEYFTAYYLYSNFFSKGRMDQLHEFIGDNIAASSWHVVIELLICKIDKAQGDFTVIDEIVERQIFANDEEAVSFFLSILKYLQNISPRMINRLFDLGIATTIQDMNTNRAMARSMNSHLMELSKSERFVKKMIKRLEEYEKGISSNAQEHSYNVFLLENAVITSRYVQIVEDKEVRERAMKGNPYIFTLLAVPLMTNVDTYEVLLKEYIVAHNDKVLTTHLTRYGSNLFFGSNNFHWITTFLFSSDYKRFVETARVLMKSGINKTKIIIGIKKDKGLIQMPYETLISFLDFETNQARKEIILAALKKYYKYNAKSKKDSKPFYKNLGNPKQRFAFPR